MNITFRKPDPDITIYTRNNLPKGRFALIRNGELKNSLVVSGHTKVVILTTTNKQLAKVGDWLDNDAYKLELVEPIEIVLKDDKDCS